MAGPRKRGDTIRRYIERTVEQHPTDIVGHVAKTFQISRQAAHGHVRTLVDQGALVAHGATRSRTYSLALLERKTFQAKLDGLEEGVLWREQALPFFESVSPRAHAICQYGFTEMVNNAIDHSEGAEVFVRLSRTAASVKMIVMDDGIGVYRKIKQALNLQDERHAIFELSKGKFTTDERKHSGLGIYFTSRAFDEFSLASGGIILTHMAEYGDWLAGQSDADEKGTYVDMVIAQNSKRTMQDVYREYQAPDNPGFSRTTVPVGLAEYGDAALVSRSQAKRVLVGLEKFKEVVFDFKDVTSIGQAFADEIFRVYQATNPDMRFRHLNANQDVRQMIAFVLGASQVG